MATGVGPGAVRAASCPTQFAFSVIPIIVGYIVAHYLSYFVEIGTQTLIQASDPLSNGSNLFGTGTPGRAATGCPTTRRSWPNTKVLAVVTGHVVGVIAAHERAIKVLPQEAPAHRSAAAAGGDDRLHRRRAVPAVLDLTAPGQRRRRPRRSRRRCGAGGGTTASPSTASARASSESPASATLVPVTSARSAAARSSGRKWTPASRAKPSTMPAMSRSDQPRLERIRLTTTRTGAPAATLAQLDQAAGEPGEPDRVGAADDHHLVGHLEGAQGELVAPRARDRGRPPGRPRG